VRCEINGSSERDGTKGIVTPAVLLFHLLTLLLLLLVGV